MLSLPPEPCELFGHLDSKQVIKLCYRHMVPYVCTKASQRIAKPEASLDLQTFPDKAWQHLTSTKTVSQCGPHDGPETALALRR